MRKITKKAIDCFYKAKPFKRNNTEIKVFPQVTVLLLHGNEIAYLYNDPDRTLSITTRGWQTNTTKERLNGLKGVHIAQKGFVWYLNGEVWDGDLIDIKGGK